MQIKKHSIKALKAYKNNSRTHSDAQIEQIANSIKEFGWTNPILLDEDKNILAGHGRLMAAEKIGMDEVPCVALTGLSEAQKKAIVIADNQLALNAGWDFDLLKSEIGDLDDLGFDLDLLGFDADALNDLLSDPLADGLTNPDDVPEIPEEPITKLGDLWVLGDHRLLCGDATAITDLDRLMNGDKVDITFTSPPYNAKQSPGNVIGQGKYEGGIKSDSMLEKDYIVFLNDFTRNSLEVSSYVFSNIQMITGNKRAVIQHLSDTKDIHADTMIWDKGFGQPAMSENVLNSSFEFIYIFSHKGNRRVGVKKFRGTIPNIFKLNSNSSNEYSKVHRATFSVDLPKLFIDWFVIDSVYEPFCGTGTTLIACESLNRKCYAMELNPKYCDVIIARWENFTGKKAVLEQIKE